LQSDRTVVRSDMKSKFIWKKKKHKYVYRCIQENIRTRGGKGSL
jgi:hypothetical protein